MYVRFNLSLRDVGELMAERGVVRDPSAMGEEVPPADRESFTTRASASTPAMASRRDARPDRQSLDVFVASHRPER